jgi:hypothetical protein
MNKRVTWWLLGLLCGTGYSASLDVFVYNIADVRFINVAPYLSFPSTEIKNQSSDFTKWVSSDQLIRIRTDQQYRTGNWAIQIYTDNVDPSFRSPDNVCPPSGITSMNLPDWVNSRRELVRGGVVSSPVTARYYGHQVTGDATNVFFPKSGLISFDGETRLPLIWRVADLYKRILIPP